MTRRTRTRRLADATADALSAPLLATYPVRERLYGAERAHQDLAERASRWTGRLGEARRLHLYRGLGVEVGDHAVLRTGCLLLRPPLAVGSMTVIGFNNTVQSATIGDDCLIAPSVSILDGTRQHRWDRIDLLVREQPEHSERVTVGNDTFVGAGAVVLADVGHHCVVAAGSVVTRPVPDWAIVAGAPAKVVGDRRELAATAAAGADPVAR